MNNLERDEGFYKKLATIVVPIVLQSLISSSLNFVDNLMVGNLGETELAAVGVAIQIYAFYWVMIFGITSGCLTFFAQFWGTKDLHSIRKSIGVSVAACMSFGILFFIMATFFPELILRFFTDIPQLIELGKDYVRIGAFCFIAVAITVPFSWALRATQQTQIPLYVSIFAFGLNTLLNYTLIFGNFGFAALGVKGAAVATLVSRTVEMLLILFVIFGRKNILAGTIDEFFDWNKDLVKRILKNAIPTTLHESFWALGNVIYAAIYARIGVTAFAAVQASMTINQIFTMAIFSFGDAIVILAGEKLGKNKLEEGYELTKRILKITVFFGVVGGITLILTTPVLVSFFNFTDLGVSLTKKILLIFGLAMPISTFAGICVTGVFRCGGDTKFAMILETCTVWLIGVPIAAVGALYFHLPIFWVIALVKIEEIIKCIISFYRVISKKWLNNVINDNET